MSMKSITKAVYLLILPLGLVGGLVLASAATKTKVIPQPSASADSTVNLNERQKWEASPDGLAYKTWEMSPAGIKVHASYEKIKRHIKASDHMEAVVVSTTFQRENANASSPKWLIVNIEGEDYMVQFLPEEFQQLAGLEVNDKIVVKSRSAGFSHNHPYLILSVDYIAQGNKILFQRDLSKTDRC